MTRSLNMKTQIKFIFDNYSSSENRRLYETERVLGSNDSIRMASLSVANEAIKHGLVDYENEVGDERAIAMYVSSKKITDAGTGYKESGFGLKYSINKDCTIRILSGYEPLHHDWKLSELEELINDGYIEGDITKLIVVLPTGLGAGLQDVFNWVGFLANILQVVTATGGIFMWFKRLIVSYKIRKVVRLWQTNGIKYPEQLREFIDTKGEWGLSEIKKRLKLTDEYAIKLLDALGLEPKANSWRLTHSKKSISNRKQWIRNENKYRKSVEITE